MNCMVVIRCPETGEEVPTGLIVDIRTFEGLPSGKTTLHCSACGTEHEWSIADAMLAMVDNGRAGGS
jgi:hypothetical protein